MFTITIDTIDKIRLSATDMDAHGNNLRTEKVFINTAVSFAMACWFTTLRSITGGHTNNSIHTWQSTTRNGL